MSEKEHSLHVQAIAEGSIEKPKPEFPQTAWAFRISDEKRSELESSTLYWSMLKTLERSCQKGKEPVE
jgi:hypothetical protein